VRFARSLSPGYDANCAQAPQGERAAQLQAALARLGLPLQHRLRRKCVPRNLLRTLAVAYASDAELVALVDDNRQRPLPVSPAALDSGWQHLCEQLRGMQAALARQIAALGERPAGAAPDAKERTHTLIGHVLQGQLEVVCSVLDLQLTNFPPALDWLPLRCQLALSPTNLARALP